MLDTLQALNQTPSFTRWAGSEVTHAADGQAELRMHWRGDDMGQYAGFLPAGKIAGSGLRASGRRGARQGETRLNQKSKLSM